MADVAAPAPAPAQTQPVSGTSLRRLVGATEIDLRLFGMLLALIGLLVGFHIMSGGTFIRPANMVTLSVQATGIAIMATGMVLIIVSRNIDLSVGSIVGLVAMSFALLQTDWLPALGLGDSPMDVAHRAGPRAGARGIHRRRAGLHHRLHRRARPSS